jgi:hypothetical protein
MDPATNHFQPYEMGKFIMFTFRTCDTTVESKKSEGNFGRSHLQRSELDKQLDGHSIT